jgi:polar amino acid transport system ATP-binding protein
LAAIRSQTGIVFQSRNLCPHLNVQRNISLGLTAGKGLPLVDANLMARESLALVGLEDKIDAYPSCPVVNSSGSRWLGRWRCSRA